MSRDPAYILDILQEARLILTFIEGIDQDAFNRDMLRQHAIERSITIIGEAARRLSDTFKEEHPNVPWKLLIGMRNILIHDYDDVKLPIIWNVVQRDIPALIALLVPLVPPAEDFQ